MKILSLRKSILLLLSIVFLGMSALISITYLSQILNVQIVGYSALSLGAFSFKSWILSFSPLVYTIIIGCLLGLSLICILIAFLKPRKKNNASTNVLIIMGEENDKIDVNLFDKNFSVLVVSDAILPQKIEPKKIEILLPIVNNNQEIIDTENINSEIIEFCHVCNNDVEEFELKQDELTFEQITLSDNQIHTAFASNEFEELEDCETLAIESEIITYELLHRFDDELEEELTAVVPSFEDEVEGEVISEVPNFEQEKEEELTAVVPSFEDEVEGEVIAKIPSFEDEVEELINISIATDAVFYNDEDIVNQSARIIAEIVEEENVIAKITSKDTTNFDNSPDILINENLLMVDENQEVINIIETDEDGNEFAEEILVDEDILKARYKTVDFSKRLCRTTEAVKNYYSDVKNYILNFKGVKSRISKKFETFTIGRFIVAKLALRGDVLKLYLALVSESLEEKYFTEDVGNNETYGKTPTLHNIKSKRGCKYGIELIKEIMEGLGLEKIEEYTPVNFVALYPPENIEDKKNEIKHLMRESVSLDDVLNLYEFSDDFALEFIEIEKNKNHTINKFKPINKFVVFIDDLNNLYSGEEVINIESLIAKGALPQVDNIFLEVRGKGSLSHKLQVEAHSYDLKAVKMIILLNGRVIQNK